MIVGEIRRYLRDNSTIRVSRSMKDIAYRSLKLREADPEKYASNEAIAKALEVDEKDVTNALKAIAEPSSLYECIYSEGGDSILLMDRIKDEKNTEEMWIEEICLLQAIKNLNDKERNIINLRYYKGRTQIEVATLVGISQAQVSRIEKSAIDRLRRQMCV
ncbi:MAG: sigma-70 family RNA polymerase sigma factor [Anaerofustis stercorihominis]|nr:sigma-70 family RNA polymerase sigma factor [Anaerofustis stercorihominis]